jgi:hypothetical protein
MVYRILCLVLIIIRPRPQILSGADSSEHWISYCLIMHEVSNLIKT